MITLLKRYSLLLVIVLLTGGFTSSLAYEVDARFLSPNAMIFPVGRLLPPGALNNADDVAFEDIQQIFELRVQEDATPGDDPAEVVFLIRLEVAGGDPIFTVSSRPVNVRQDAEFRLGRYYTNFQLARIQSMAVGEGDDVNANAVLPYIDGGNMREGLYILTVLLASRDATTSNWDQYVNGGNYGISSATMRAYNPSQVTLTQPRDGQAIQTAYPVFSWRFPRNQDVNFRLELVSGAAEANGTAVLDNRNAENTFLVKTIPAGRGAGELTTYSYTGSGDERPLEIGGTYYWRVTAFPPTMFLTDDNQILRNDIASQVFSFRYGYSMPQEIVLMDPSPGATLEMPPTFSWVFPPLPELRFELKVYQGDDDQGDPFSQINIQAGQFGSENRSYRYGQGFNEPDLSGGQYTWKVVAYANIDGSEVSLESATQTFTFSPTVELMGLQPSSGEEIRSATPLIAWTLSNNFQAGGFVINIVGAPMNRAGEISAEMLSNIENIPQWAFSQRLEVAGNLRQTMPSSPLRRGYVYFWAVGALSSDGGELTYTSEPIGFSYPLPPQPDLSLIELTEPPSGSSVNIGTPRFRWTAPNIPQFFQSMVTFEVEVRDENGSVMGGVEGLAHNTREWQYQGSALVLGNRYGWNVTAKLELPGYDPVRFPTQANLFTYSRWPSENDLVLSSPANSSQVYTGTPTFEWRFPQGWDVTFTILLSLADHGFRREIEINDGNARQYTYAGEAFPPGSYTWDIVAHVTVGRETRDIASSQLNFTYTEQVSQAPPITLNEPTTNAVVESNPTFTWSMQELPDNITYSFVVEVRPVEENVAGGGVFDVPGASRQYIYEGEGLVRGRQYTWLVRVVIDKDPVDLVGVSETRTFTYSPPERRQQQEGASPAERILAALNALPDNVLPQQLRAALGRSIRGSNIEAIRYNGAEITLDQLLQIIQQMGLVNMIQG